MRINESTIRRIIREEARQVMREGFNTKNGMPNDTAGVITVLTNVGKKLAKSSDISKQEYWTLHLFLEIASNRPGVLDNVVSEIARNEAALSKHLGISEEPAAGPTNKQDGNDDSNL